MGRPSKKRTPAERRGLEEILEALKVSARLASLPGHGWRYSPHPLKLEEDDILLSKDASVVAPQHHRAVFLRWEKATGYSTLLETIAQHAMAELRFASYET